ncbi:uncharacterized protein DNG_06031 [Cephalotrichum gorgonifer]|uniref:Uncharacterized protein n=1 Tax=Cephalotrichum gorgonifer TaxID=2041049 RepID=A0AAE8N0Y0_9PEZI|nr:uncharacterized protein DNG_06031 [Cephalotrichum gorgonifer]
MDEDEEDPFVDVILNIELLSGADEKPIKGLGADKAPSIPRKPKVEAANGVKPTNGAEANGVHPPEPETKTLKRPRADDDDEVVESKKAKKVQPEAEDDDVVIVEDEGVILIDDD